MSGDGVDEDDMDFERGANDALGSFFDDLRAAAAELPGPVAGAALTTLFEQGATPAAVTVAQPARRRRGALKVAVAGAVGGLAFGGLGVAGALPAPVQLRVSEVVDVVGVHLPDGRPATTTTTGTPASTTKEVGPRTGGSDEGDSRRTDDRSGNTPTTNDDHGGGEVGDDRSGRDGGPSGSSDDRGSGSRRGSTTTTLDDHRGGSGDGGSSSGKGSGGAKDRSGSGGGVADDAPGAEGSGSGSGHG